MQQESLEERIRRLEQQVDAEKTKKKLLTKFKKKFSWKYAVIIGFGVVLIAAGGFFIMFHTWRKNDPVPSYISSSVHFPIYLPSQPNLPAGFTLDKGSFNTREGAVIYDVVGPNSAKLVFTLQKQPSAGALQSFYNSRMPLSIPVTTSIGTAEIGNLLNEQVVSLPITNGPWLLVTAPLSFNQYELKQIIQTMTKA